MNISRVHARQILDSRGNPTVEVDVQLADGSLGRASIPSGASTGSHEVHELRDGGEAFLGKGVSQAVNNVNLILGPNLLNNDAYDQIALDNELVTRDGTTDLSRYGANAILGISLAVSKAASLSKGIPYYQYIHELARQVDPTLSHQPFRLPMPMFNVLNGGAHTNWETTDIQEFMVVPVGARSFSQAYQWGSEIYQHLKQVLSKSGLATTLGDEGGFAPKVTNDDQAVNLIIQAIEHAKILVGSQIKLSLDVAASEFFQNHQYQLPIAGEQLNPDQLSDRLLAWTHRFPLFSVEDGLAEDDWQAWPKLTSQLRAQNVWSVGDDLLVTNTQRISQAIDSAACNVLLMKLNQIGTLTESLKAISLAHQAGWPVIVSHRSGETEDTSIADIAVGAGCEYIKVGAPARSERTAKYNQLLRIEEQLNT